LVIAGNAIEDTKAYGIGPQNMTAFRSLPNGFVVRSFKQQLFVVLTNSYCNTRMAWPLKTIFTVTYTKSRPWLDHRHHPTKRIRLMSFKIRFVLVVCLTSSIVGVGVGSSDDGPAGLETTVWSVNVLSDLGLDVSTQQVYQSMAAVLTGVSTIPMPRTAFWSAVDSPPDVVITGWGGSVSNVSDDGAGGHFVLVIVSPIVVLANGGQIFADANYSERWHVDANNVASFVAAFDPTGAAGLIPSLFID